MTLDARSAGVFLLAAVAPFSSPLHARRSQNVSLNLTATVVRMEKTPHGVAYRINSKPVGHTPTTDILRSLSLINEQRGVNAPVVVLVDPGVSFTEVWNFEGMAGKAQLNDLRFFVLSPDRLVMTELKWGWTVPFSTIPN